MTKQEFNLLVKKILNNEASPEEEQMVINFLDSFQQDQMEESAVMEKLPQLKREVLAQVQQEIQQQVLQERTPTKGRLRQMLLRIGAVAAVLAGLLVGAYFLFDLSSAEQNAATYTQNEIKPGKNGALLTLGNGKILALDDITKDTTVVVEDGTKIKISGGQIIYLNEPALVGSGNIPKNVYHELRTPAGRQFKTRLPDGSVVWLNAGSSIRYPAVFQQDNRAVEATGELYFQVAHDVNRPFVVSCRNGYSVKVLGTSFNINAYENENAISTSLLEGKVLIEKQENDAAVKAGEIVPENKTMELLPGYTSVWKNGSLSAFEDENIQASIAWTKGVFSFNNTDLGSVMRQLSRWYDVEIEMTFTQPVTFSGAIYRTDEIKDVLKLISFTSNVKFEWQGRKLKVIAEK